MRILISGCGYVGTALGLLLADDGHTVFGLRREPSNLPPAIHPVAADLSGPLQPDALPPSIDAVVYAVSPGAVAAADASYRAAYVEGPRNLLAALERQGSVQRLLFVSSTGVFGQTGGEWVDEASPTEPRSAAGRSLLDGERLVVDGPVPAVVLRLGGIYGPGRTGTIERALDAPPRADEPPRYTNRIHRDDCAGALRHVLTLPDPNSLYLGVDSDPADRSTVTEWLASHLGEDPDRRKNAPSSQRSQDVRTLTNKRCSNRRLVASGYAFRYPTYREGFAALLADYGLPT